MINDAQEKEGEQECRNAECFCDGSCKSKVVEHPYLDKYPPFKANDN